jgi:hypothetical protein
VHRRRDVWRRFARRHGLRVTGAEAIPALNGMVDGREFSLRGVSGGSDAEELGIVEIEMSLGVRGPFPADLEIEDATGVIGEAQRVLAERTLITGDEDFDRASVVRCADPERARTWLNERRRRAFLDLEGRHSSDEVGLAQGRLYLRDRELVSRLEDLESRLALLREATPAFDEDSYTGPNEQWKLTSEHDTRSKAQGC